MNEGCFGTPARTTQSGLVPSSFIESLNLVLTEAKRQIVEKAARAAGERSQGVGRCIVTEADFLEAARQMLPRTVYDLETALANDDDSHVRYAS